MVRAANRFAARVFSGQTLHLCCRGIELAQVSRYVPSSYRTAKFGRSWDTSPVRRNSA